MEFTNSDNPEIDCFDCVASICPYFRPDEEALSERPNPGQCPRKIEKGSSFRNGKTTDQLNIEMVRHLTPQDLYLDLMKKSLTNYIYGQEKCLSFVDKIKFIKRHKKLVDKPDYTNFNYSWLSGRYSWNNRAQTMIGIWRLDNIRDCVETCLNENIPGDLVETGVWRGGATIYMRSILKAYDITDRSVWVCDSFEGLPHPGITGYIQDIGDKHYKYKSLSIPLEEVKNNFRKYGLLDNQVIFLKGWFKDTLPNANIKKIAVLRLDGDMYSSTMDALVSLYPKLSDGGYCIVDDYGELPGCKQAVDDYRVENKIKCEIIKIENTNTSPVYWKK